MGLIVPVVPRFVCIGISVHPGPRPSTRHVPRKTYRRRRQKEMGGEEENKEVEENKEMEDG